MPAPSYLKGVFYRILLVAAIPSLFFPTFMLVSDYQSGAKDLQARALQMLDALSNNSIEGLLTGQADSYLEPLAQWALFQNETSGVIFEDNSGKVLLSKMREAKNELFVLSHLSALPPEGHGELYAPSGRLLYFRKTVKTWKMSGEEQIFGYSKQRSISPIGTVTLIETPQLLYQSLIRNLFLCLLLIVPFLALASLVARGISLKVTKPVFDLIGAFKAFEMGDYNPPLPNPKERELSELVIQFKTTTSRFADLLREKDVTASQLIATAQELEELNSTLEDKIAERTRELLNAKDMLEISSAEAKEANRLKSEFLANMSHELRTPLNAVIGFSELILEEIPGPLSQDQRECVDDILSAGRHLLKLINEILDLSKVEAGKMPTSHTTAKTQDIVQDILAMMKPLVERKFQELIVIDDSASPTIYTDQVKLKQILINLLSNANKFSDNYKKIRLEIKSDERKHSISITDDGMGIEQKDIPNIFEAFRQLDGSPSRSHEGTGLGLTLCKRFTELLGGQIVVKSVLGKGSTFTVYIPLEPSKPVTADEMEKCDGQSACG
jgi:signal transduction histidine kinase